MNISQQHEPMKYFTREEEVSCKLPPFPSVVNRLASCPSFPASVRAESIRASETLSTVLAGKASITRVDSLVALEVVFAFKGG